MSKKTNKKDRNILVILLCVAIILLLFFVFQKNKTMTYNQGLEIPPPSIPYTQLPSSVNPGQLETFTDNLLKTSFKYPKSYYPQYLKADKDELSANIFFLKNRDAEKEAAADSVIECMLTNRTDPSGLCREGYLDDIEVWISQPLNIPNDNDEDYKDCEKDVISENKVIYSCSSQLSIDPNDWGMSYKLYLLGNSPKVISMITGKPKDVSDLINSIVNTSRVLP